MRKLLIAIAALCLSVLSTHAETTTHLFDKGDFTPIKKDVIATYGLTIWKQLEQAFSIRSVDDKALESGQKMIRALSCIPHNCSFQAYVWVYAKTGKVMAICFMDGFPDAEDH
jgi:hypothetical protein